MVDVGDNGDVADVVATHRQKNARRAPFRDWRNHPAYHCRGNYATTAAKRRAATDYGGREMECLAGGLARRVSRRYRSRRNRSRGGGGLVHFSADCRNFHKQPLSENMDLSPSFPPRERLLRNAQTRRLNNFPIWTAKNHSARGEKQVSATVLVLFFFTSPGVSRLGRRSLPISSISSLGRLQAAVGSIPGHACAPRGNAQPGRSRVHPTTRLAPK